MTTDITHDHHSHEIHNLHERGLFLIEKSVLQRQQCAVVQGLIEKGVCLLQSCAEAKEGEIQGKRDDIEALIREIDDYSLRKWGAKVSEAG